MSCSIKLLSANCQGLGNIDKRMDVLKYLEQLNCDVVCLQDTHWTEKDSKRLRNLWPGEIILNGFKSNSRGVAILMKDTFEYSILDIFSDNCGNLLTVDLKTNDMSFKIINIYAPNTDTPSIFQNVIDIIDSNVLDYFLLCGDLNLVLDTNLDCYNYKYINNPQSRKLLLKSIENENWVDIFRYFNPTTKRYTWRRKNPLKQARLDYFIASQSFLDNVNKCVIRPGYRSDHSFVELNLITSHFVKGRGVWKFNCSLLKNKEYLIQINILIAN